MKLLYLRIAQTCVYTVSKKLYQLGGGFIFFKFSFIFNLTWGNDPINVFSNGLKPPTSIPSPTLPKGHSFYARRQRNKVCAILLLTDGQDAD